ncbi:Odorant receptor [Nesidiocoris tenuis]|uniref:Odorant receptor n=1 Tax=Nesidiocoris tenuis TaxID=355587 RepID=A0ABN7AVH1_9HEMI|nr:Odorant receptor [Nesidiocoris tenuis]
MNTVQESKSWMIQRRQLLDGYDSIHSLTLTKSFYGDFPDSELWNDRKLWFHLLCTLFSELTFMMFEVYNFITKETFFEALLSLTICLISILVLTRTYVFYTGLRTIRRLYFKPEVFHSNKHRPVGSLTRLKEVTQHGRNVGFWCLVVFIANDIAWLIFPLASPIMELISGTNKTYDELIPMYPSVMPVQVPWLRKEIKYLYDLVVGVVNTMPWVGSIVIYYSIVNLLRTQHEILCSSLFPTSVDRGDDDMNPIHLKLWIEDHVLLRKMIFELRELMSPTLAVTVVANFFMIGLSMLALMSQPVDSDGSVSDKITYYFTFGMYTCSCLNDLFVHCWLSSVISDCGDQLRAALYESNWDSDLKRCSEDIVVPLMLCGKKIQLTAFGMIPIQIQTFIEVLRLSYSYYTLLSSTGD